MKSERPATSADPAPGSPPYESSPPETAPPQEETAPSAADAPTESTADPFDPAVVHPLDWGILAAGFLALLFSFVSYYTGTARSVGLRGSVTESMNAWHGFFGWFAVVVALAAAVLLAVHIFLPRTRYPMLVRSTVLAGFTVASVCVTIAAFVTPDKLSPSLLKAFNLHVEYGRGAGFWLSLIVILAGAVMSFLRLRESGGSLSRERSRT